MHELGFRLIKIVRFGNLDVINLVLFVNTIIQCLLTCENVCKLVGNIQLSTNFWLCTVVSMCLCLGIRLFEFTPNLD